ncbi:glycosyltransferase family 2 protein [Clostridium beijerinckii]|uniref:glycosyltransferase family 2 protein n=1 Tax=Clostridium beijerinckii TaxID=1520 RepID=UPI001360F697|nr:glycosyltransferase family 2 protein [Clostridium beijerinckii]MZK49882.1 glycosyltransferase [Clostridium beijerinckii]MZK57841.1 glycosyltransferase [Clostridium beijerinckii]MZK68052.1 glycosyltransferase [Clostridium beijerinckii]MZK73550.1 glycosyltransferase [Clostridium beijerinckii]MZK83132.1 glycosyltransferase [Clostridium beijerinckii]
MNKKASIIIPAYNHEIYIENCFDSIINQTYSNIELIILNDGSKDNTHEKIQGYMSKLKSRFNDVIYINKENEGICKTLNKGLELATGEYIINFASDDVMMESRVEKQVFFLENNPEYDIVYSDCYDVKSDGWLDPLGEYDLENLISKRCNFEQGDLLEFMLENVFYMPTPTVCFKKLCFDKVGKYDENILCEDPDMFIRTAKYFKYGYINEPLVLHRIHKNNSGRNSEIIVNSIKTMIEKYYNNTFLNENQKNKFLVLLQKSIGNVVINEKIIGNRKLVVWGTGSAYLKNNLLKKYKIEFFVDSDKNKQKNLFESKKVYSPEVLKSMVLIILKISTRGVLL